MQRLQQFRNGVAQHNTCVGVARIAARTQRINDPLRRLDADVCEQQLLFELLECFLIEAAPQQLANVGAQPRLAAIESLA